MRSFAVRRMEPAVLPVPAEQNAAARFRMRWRSIPYGRTLRTRLRGFSGCMCGVGVPEFVQLSVELISLVALAALAYRLLERPMIEVGGGRSGSGRRCRWVLRRRSGERGRQAFGCGRRTGYKPLAAHIGSACTAACHCEVSHSAVPLPGTVSRRVGSERRYWRYSVISSMFAERIPGVA